MCKKEEESISLPDSSTHAFFETWKIIHWNSANVTIDAQMKKHVYIWASLPCGFRSNIKGHSSGQRCPSVKPSALPSHFSSAARCRSIQVWGGGEGLTQPAARQRLYSAVSIIQIQYLPLSPMRSPQCNVSLT